MTLSSSNAILAHPMLDHDVWPDWQYKSSADAPTDLSTVTNSGHVADIIVLTIENSGSSRFYIVNFRHSSNTGMINLLRRWIDEYGDDEDPDLDLQLAELRSNRLALREQC
jgi:hypothetical protein